MSANETKILQCERLFLEFGFGAVRVKFATKYSVGRDFVMR